MVTSTSDELVTHDAYGTDLSRVRAMHERGFPVALIAECLGITKYRASYALAVATGDREGAPTPEEIAARCEEIQRTWSEEVREQAAAGCRYSIRNPEAAAAAAEKHRQNRLDYTRRKLEAADVNITFLHWIKSERKWWARPVWNHRRASRVFATREEAVEFGVAWMRRQAEIDARLAESGCDVNPRKRSTT